MPEGVRLNEWLGHAGGETRETMSKQALIYLLCNILGALGPLYTLRLALSPGDLPLGLGAFVVGALGGLWCAAWMIGSRIYVMRHGTGRGA